MISTLTHAALIVILAISSITIQAQNFEGWITYRLTVLNPDPSIIPDSVFQEIITEQIGEGGVMMQKYHYKNDRYISEITSSKQKGYQAYNPDDGLIYSWEENSDTAVTVDSRRYLDEFVEIEKTEGTATVMGIPCSTAVVRSRLGEMTLWYNPDHFKMDPELYKGHVYGHFEQMLRELGALPLKMEMKAGMTHMVQEAIDHKETSIDDARFTIPEHKVVIENPMN